MKNKIIVKLNVNKINKDKIKEKVFKLADGTEIRNKEYELEIVPLKVPKFIKRGTTQEGEEWQLLKIGFVIERKLNKEEKDVFLGDALEFEKIGMTAMNIPSETYEEVVLEKEDIDIDIPF